MYNFCYNFLNLVWIEVLYWLNDLGEILLCVLIKCWLCSLLCGIGCMICYFYLKSDKLGSRCSYS